MGKEWDASPGIGPRHKLKWFERDLRAACDSFLDPEMSLFDAAVLSAERGLRRSRHTDVARRRATLPLRPGTRVKEERLSSGKINSN
jgi:hypothetical protein